LTYIRRVVHSLWTPIPVTNYIMANRHSATADTHPEKTPLAGHDTSEDLVRAPEGGRETKSATLVTAKDHVKGSPVPRLHKKKSSYDLRDQFQHGENVGRDDHVPPGTEPHESKNQPISHEGGSKTD
jgi:hypothetical protein